MRSVRVAAALVSAACLASADARLSSVVAFSTSADGAGTWLETPGNAFVEAWVRIPSNLSASTIFGIDQELIEGLDNPLYVAGGDWMGLTGVQRGGVVWVAVGNASTMAGNPSTERTWLQFPLGQALLSDTWYRIRNEVDFAHRTFVNFSIDGPGLSQTIDLAGQPLDYPNSMPFDHRAYTSYVWAMDGTAIGGDATTPSAVWFDDVAYGPLADALPEPTWTRSDNVETGGMVIPGQPLPPAETLPYVIPVAGYIENAWYLERDEALVGRMRTASAHSGYGVMVCDASLADTAPADWLAATRQALNTAPAATPQTLAIEAGADLGIVLDGQDAEGDALVFSVLSGPEHGTLTGMAPNLIYRPGVGFHGIDTLTFEASDGLAAASATVTVTVASPGDPGGSTAGGSGGGCGAGAILGLVVGALLGVHLCRSPRSTTTRREPQVNRHVPGS